MPRPETGDASRDTKLQAAARAVVGWEALFSARRGDLLGDALAALHAEALAAPSLEALRPLAEDWALRAALFEVTARAKDAPYVRRAATELALAFEAVAPWDDRPRRRVADALVRVSERLATAPEEPARVVSLAALLAVTAASSAWARAALEGDRAWATVLLAGLLAFVAVAWEWGERGQGRSPFQRRMAKAARASGGVWAIALLALVVLTSMSAPAGLGVGLAFALAAAVVSPFPAIATFALAAALRRVGVAASRPLRRLSRRALGEAPRAPRAAGWAFTAVRVSREDAAREVGALREAQRSLDARVREVESALRDDAEAASPEDRDAGGPYRRRETPGAGDSAGGPARGDDALEGLLRKPTAKARRLRERYLAHLAHEAAATEDDDAAARLVEEGAARLERAKVAMTPAERRGVARVAAWSRGGVRRLQRLAGEAMVTDDGPAPAPTGVRVRVDPTERAEAPVDARGEGEGSARRPEAARGARG